MEKKQILCLIKIHQLRCEAIVKCAIDNNECDSRNKELREFQLRISIYKDLYDEINRYITIYRRED